MEQVSGFYFPPSGQTSSGFSEMEEISVGGFNVLIRAKRDGKWWVLKALAPDVRHNEVFRSLLHKEYDILSKIQHPGVVYVRASKWWMATVNAWCRNGLMALPWMNGSARLMPCRSAGRWLTSCSK